jgi:peptidoglycan-associated lipoprotein
MKSAKFAVVFTLTLLCAFSLVACQKKAATKPDTAQQQAMEQKQKEQEKVTEKKIDSKIESVAVKEGETQYAESKQTIFSDILFDYDKYSVADTYRPVLQSVASWMTTNTAARLSIEGHCDERGTNEYNLALGDRRAKAVKDYLVSLGVASGRIDIISYGEERPLCTEQSDACWAKNRRAHFIILIKVGK